MLSPSHSLFCFLLSLLILSFPSSNLSLSSTLDNNFQKYNPVSKLQRQQSNSIGSNSYASSRSNRDDRDDESSNNSNYHLSNPFYGDAEENGISDGEQPYKDIDPFDGLEADDEINPIVKPSGKCVGANCEYYFLFLK